jgi:DNA polymerase delta subunit 1
MSTFQAVAWEGYDDEEGQYIVRAYGRTEDGKSVAASTIFEPYFFVKMGSRIPEVRGAKIQYVNAKDLWGFQNGVQSRFAKLTFQTFKDFKIGMYTLQREKWKIYEANLDPVLRFMHISGCTSTGWIKVTEEEDDPDTRCDVNLRGTLSPVLGKDTVAPLKVMSFDIECYSSTGNFPDPKIPGDCVFQIGMTTRDFGMGSASTKKCLCLKQTDGPDCESFNTEKELLEAFGKYLARVDPDIITGWNIFGFDLEFLFVRASRLGVETLWGRRNDQPSELVVKHLASSALGSNELKMVPMVGRYVFDLFQDIKREHKLESYSLNACAKHFLNDQKMDMPVKEIFSRFLEGDSARLGEVAEYCIKDTMLPHEIMAKVCQLQNQIEMAKACWVPLSYLSERGQQIKVFSQMAYKARQLGFLIPTIRRPEGPVDGYEGATVLEAQTGAYYTPITALDFASLYPSIMVAHNLCYSTLVMDTRYANLPGVTYETYGEHTFAQTDADGKPIVSLLPAILTDLKAFRKKAKKLMAQAEGTPMEAVYNGQQLAYKISMNSIYGFTGAGKGMLPLVAIASTVTRRGRQMIEETKNYVEAHFPGANVRYGDSVMPETPVLVKISGVIQPVKIENLASTWETYPGFLKEGTDKDSSEVVGVEAWTHRGWQPVKRVIRHKCAKKIYRVLTHTGLVDVTEDHSLLGPGVELLKPKEVMVGQKLFHSFPKDISTEFNGKIYVDNGEKLMKMFDGDIERVRPKEIIFDMSDSAVTLQQKFPKHTIHGITSQIEAHMIYTRLSQLGFKNISLNFYGGIQIIFSSRKSVLDPTAIKKISVLHEEWDGYVYDLETEAGTFQAGVGQMIVKNTDSVMVEFDVQGRTGQDAIDYSWQQGLLAAEQCTKLFKAPNDLELEKVYCPYFLYSKKRYAAKMWEGKTRPDGSTVVAFKKVDIKGLQVVRRDSCPFVRETLKKLLDMMLESSDPRPVITFARQASAELATGKVPIEKLLMSKQLGQAYKVPMPHVAVRDKIRSRAPGSEPQQGDRVPFVVVAGPGKLFEKSEDPTWVREKGVPLDYQYYFVNQLKKPVCDLLEPLVGANPERLVFGAATAGNKKGTFDSKMKPITSFFGPK